MPSTPHKLLLATLGCVLLALVAGCQLPAFDRSEPRELDSAPARTASAQSPDTPTAEKLPASKPPAKPNSSAKLVESATAAADDATVATVMEEARKISADNPEAGRILLDELAQADPKLWPLVIQQFRSRQVMREQLLNRPQAATDPDDEKIEELVTNDRPSEAVGQLADPRRARPDPAVEQAFATATPANMPAPIDAEAAAMTAVAVRNAPATFAPEAVAQPIATAVPANAANNAVIQASTSESGRVEQALYQADEAVELKSTESRDWQQHLQLAVDDLHARLADGPRSTAEVHQVVSLRLMQLLAGNTEAALQPIPNVSTQEQDYWSGQIFALATFLDHHRQPDDERRAAASVIHLDEAVGHLRELSSLSVRNLAFCKNVFGYGAYEPINNPVFSPGQQLTLYLEVENYHSESTAKGYATKLGASYEIVDESGERIAGGDFPNIEDLCQSRRRDFHIQYGLALPKTAKSGKHHLKILIDDRQSDKRGNASIAFEVR